MHFNYHYRIPCPYLLSTLIEMARAFNDANSFLPPAFERMVTANGWSTSNALNASRLKLSLTASPKIVPSSDSEDLLAHKVCTDHMIVARRSAQTGWTDPEMVPFAPISLSPTASVQSDQQWGLRIRPSALRSTEHDHRFVKDRTE